MPALPKFLVLLAIILLARSGDTLMNLSSAAGNLVLVNNLIRFVEPTVKPTKQHYQNKESTVYQKSRMQSFQARFLFWLLNLLPTPFILLRQSMAWVTLTLIIQWPVEWLSMMSRIVRSKAYVLICPYLNPMNGKCQNKSTLILAVYEDLLEQRFCVGEKKRILIPLSRN